MIYPVKVFYPDGKLKKIISSKVITNRTWRSLGCTTASYKEPSLSYLNEQKQKQKQNEIKCKYCHTFFTPRFKTTIVCSSKTCRQSYYRLHGAAPVMDKICIVCLKPFRGTESRVYCNKPCLYQKKSRATIKTKKGKNEIKNIKNHLGR